VAEGEDRRMRIRVLSFICLFILVASCTSSPQQYAVLVTATASVESVVPIHANTPPSPTYTTLPSQTNPPSPTATSTTVPTKPPTAPPTLMPPLRVEGAGFIEGDKQIILTGAVVTKFVTQQAADDPLGVSLPHAKAEIDALVSMGANLVIFQWNSGQEYLGNPLYVSSLVKAIKYAKSRGLRVELVLHSRGKDPNTNWKEKQITVLDERIVSDWEKLLDDEEVAGELADSVDVFGVLSEAEFDTSHNRVSIYNPNLWDAASAIRSLLKKPDALCTFSIGEWGGDAQELQRVPQEMRDKIRNEKIAIEIHQYLRMNVKRPLEYITRLQELGIPIVIGETGQLPWDDQRIAQDYYREVLEFIKKHGLSFAWFAIDVFNDNPKDRYIHIWNKNGITDWGKLVTTYFANYNK
jgi:hypothetical protein